MKFDYSSESLTESLLDDPLRPVSKTLPATSGATNSDGSLKSLLEELDEE